MTPAHGNDSLLLITLNRACVHVPELVKYRVYCRCFHHIWASSKTANYFIYLNESHCYYFVVFIYGLICWQFVYLFTCIRFNWQADQFVFFLPIYMIHDIFDWRCTLLKKILYIFDAYYIYCSKTLLLLISLFLREKHYVTHINMTWTQFISFPIFCPYFDLDEVIKQSGSPFLITLITWSLPGREDSSQ